MEVVETKGIIYEFGEFVLDPHERTLLSAGKNIHLTDKVFDTLLVLIKNNGRLLTKSEMMEALWSDSFVEEGNLAKNVSRLRKVLNTNDVELIKTVPKRGYRFQAEVRQIHGNDDLYVHRNMRVKISHEVETAETVLAQPAGRLSIYLISGLAVILLAVAAGWYFNRKPAVQKAKISSIAVMPLKPLTPGEDNDALGLGLTDALITRLGSLGDITVRPTNAVAKFADTDTETIAIGRRLNVDAVLEGSIQQSNGRVRINARLVRVANGEQVWTDIFDESVTNIFALQDALSGKIAKTLVFELSSAERIQLVRRPTENLDAYEKYLRGRFYQSQNTEAGLTKAIAFYEQAIALDRQFADAYAGLGDANLILYNFGLRPADEVIPRARLSVESALQLNPNLPEVYTARAMIQYLAERDWPAAENSLLKAIELKPNSADAYLRYGYFLTAEGNIDQAQIQLEKAMELNPVSTMARTDMGLASLVARRYPAAIEQLEKVTAENPEAPLPRWFLGLSYEGNLESEKAFAAYMQALRLEGKADLAVRLEQVNESNGKQAALRAWLGENLKIRARRYVPAVNIAKLYADLQDREQTLVWLKKALDEREPTFWQIKYLPEYDFLRDDARFQDFVRKLDSRI